jgi:peptidoglycan/xylan/chitin deacetylase (PgdA/CDA1 family)
MTHRLYDYSAIARRPRLALPDGKRVAVWFGLNIEHYAFGQPALSLAEFTAQLVPDPLNYGWRDYGPRVGVWRLGEIFANYGVPVTAVINSEVCDHYPEIVDAGVEAGWAWVAHGANNSTWQTGMEPDAEREYLDGVAERIASATGSRPRGWLGPALTASMATNGLLAELGFDYVLDWANDDQPYPMNVGAGNLISVPYSSEVNDIPIFHLHHGRGEDFERAVVDSVEVLAADGTESARVLGVGVHPFLLGQPFRAKYLDRALATVAARDDVWLASADEIASWYVEASA